METCREQTRDSFGETRSATLWEGVVIKQLVSLLAKVTGWNRRMVECGVLGHLGTVKSEKEIVDVELPYYCNLIGKNMIAQVYYRTSPKPEELFRLQCVVRSKWAIP
jgi:hypothetical protein